MNSSILISPSHHLSMKNGTPIVFDHCCRDWSSPWWLGNPPPFWDTPIWRDTQVQTEQHLIRRFFEPQLRTTPQVCVKPAITLHIPCFFLCWLMIGLIGLCISENKSAAPSKNTRNPKDPGGNTQRVSAALVSKAMTNSHWELPGTSQGLVCLKPGHWECIR